MRNGYLFIGVKGSRSHIEKLGNSVNAGLVLGYSRVTRRERTRKTVTQTRSYTRTIRRVIRQKRVEIVNGVRRTSIVTRVVKKTVRCRSSSTRTRTTSKTSIRG
jgi:hypothetical protein